jgi:hypothetical protein
MAKVVNRGPSALCLRGSVNGRAQELDLEVGATEVDDAKLEALLESNPYNGKLFDLQCSLEVASERAPDEGSRTWGGEYVQDLSKLKLPDALRAIEACTDPTQLRAWVLTDSRAAVKKALHLRDRALRPGDKNEDAEVTKAT